DVIVTVNSSVGFEATYFDKVVVVLGEAVYKPQGIFPSIDDVIEGRVDVIKYRHNLSILRRFMLESYLTPTLAVKDPSHFYRRILELVDIKLTAASSIEIAQRYYESFGRSQRQHQLSWMVGGISRPGISDFVIPMMSSLAQIIVVPGVDPTFDQAAVVAAIVKATGRKSKEELIEFLRKGWREPEFRVAVLDVISLFNQDYYLSENKDVAEAKMDPKSHFVLYGEAEGRNPHPSINLTEYLRTSSGGRPDQGMLNLLVNFIRNSNLRDGPTEIASDADTERSVLDYVLDQREEELVEKAHLLIKDSLAGSKNQIAVVAHLYYRDLVSELLDQLKQLPPDFDLIVTMPDWGTAAIEATVRQHFPAAVLCSLPNRGRDIGPFLEVLPHLIERQYSTVLKLQTKRGYYVAGRLKPRMGEKWRELTYQSLVGGAEQTKNIIRSFSNLPGLNLVGPAPFFLSLGDYPYHDEGELAAHYTHVPPTRLGFFAGTMFWFRPKAFAPLVVGANALNIRSFNSDNGSTDGQLAHLVERLFGHIAASSSMAIGAVTVSPGEYVIEIGPDPVHEKIHDFLVREIEAAEKAVVKSLTW
ncbi:MAG TPA: rhamnan synthesis F family protein, partial [Rhizobium sp.]